MKKTIITLIVLLLIVSGVYGFLEYKSKNPDKFEEKITNLYQGRQVVKNPVQYNDKYALYFGDPDNEDCKKVDEKVLEFVKSQSVPCYVINTKETKLTPKEGKEATDNMVGQPIADVVPKNIPTILLVQNGTVKQEGVGITTKGDIVSVEDAIAKFKEGE